MIINKIIIVTANKDKTEIVSNILRSILSSNIEISSLLDFKDYTPEDERGGISDRAKAKVVNFIAWSNHLEPNNSLIVGIDDGFKLKTGEVSPHSKEITQQILEGKLLKQNEVIYLNRAYCFYFQDAVSECVVETPFVYHHQDEAISLEDQKYPLNYVLGYQDRKCTVSEEDPKRIIEFDLKYAKKPVSESLQKLFDLKA